MKIFKSRTFQWWAIGLVKICLLSCGILLGLYFYNYLIGLLWLWWGLFAVTAVYFTGRFVNEK
jgi:hypothetical protein